jgi:nucleotide-binding universal stress UspA family protein
MKVGKILVPLDGSVLSEAALRKAVEMADGATLSLLRAAEVRAPSAGDSPESQVAALREAQQYLRRIVKQLEQKGIDRVEAYVWYGPPAAAIVGAAQAQKIDLIVMATDGRSGLCRVEPGSVAATVLRGTLVPVSRRSSRGHTSGHPNRRWTRGQGVACISERSFRLMAR